MRISAQQRRILRVLCDAPGTACDVAEELGEQPKAVGMTLSRMLQRGGTVRVFGLYRGETGRPARIFEAIPGGVADELGDAG